MMLKIISLALLLALSATAFSQPVTPGKSDYFRKSKNQNTAAWVMLGGGFAVSSAGLIIGFGGTVEAIAGIFTGETSNSFRTGEVLFYTGLAAMAGSIPLFIASSRNRKKAMSLSWKNETCPVIVKQSFSLVNLPSLSLKINL